jgi:thiosulfate dehydrogenase (quinone) large subunit
MKLTQRKIVEWFLRIALSAGFLSAVADRFGLWNKQVSAWGNWASFVDYTQALNPYMPVNIIPLLAYVATALEILLGVLLLFNFKTKLVAKASGFLLLLFGVSMAIAKGIKLPLDYSVFCASAAAFALSSICGEERGD